MLDRHCRRLIATSPNLMIPWYLMASYSYYIEDDPILSDSLYDELAKRMLESWATLEHRHKGLITEDDLRAGTLLGVREYPGMVVEATKSARRGL